MKVENIQNFIIIGGQAHHVDYFSLVFSSGVC